MRRHGAAAIPFEHASQTGTQNDGTCQRNGAADGMDDRRTCEITEGQRLHNGEPAIRPPGPVTDDWIDKSSHTHTIKQIADETCPPNHRTRCDCGTGIRKGKLKDPEGQQGNPGRTVNFWNTL